MLQGPRAAAAAANGGHCWSPMSPAWTRSPSPGCRWTPLASRYWNAVVGHRASRAPCRRLRSAIDENQSGFQTSGGERGRRSRPGGERSRSGQGQLGREVRAAARREDARWTRFRMGLGTQTLEFLVTLVPASGASTLFCAWVPVEIREGVSLRAPRVVRWLDVSACDPVLRMDTVPTLSSDIAIPHGVDSSFGSLSLTAACIFGPRPTLKSPRSRRPRTWWWPRTENVGRVSRSPLGSCSSPDPRTKGPKKALRR